MNKYRYEVYNALTGDKWDTIELKIIAQDKTEAYKKAFDLACNHDYQEEFYPYLLPLKSSFRMIERGVNNG